MTLTEKLLSLYAGLEGVASGDKVTVEVPRFLFGESDFFEVLEQVRSKGMALPGAAKRIVAALDQIVDSSPGDRRNIIRTIRDRSREWGIQHLYELGRGGIEAVIFPDGGMVRPGDLVVVGKPELLSFGALGALAFALQGEALVQAVQEGRMTLEVPETIRLVFRGQLNRWVGGKDLAIHAWELLGPQGAAGKTVEFTGESVMGLDLWERLALGSFATNTGARSVLIPPDEKTKLFARARSDRSFPFHVDEEGAVYSQVLEIDAGALEPLVAFHAEGNKARSVSKMRSTKIDQVIIGTGGNGRIEDLRIAAGLLREYQVNPKVRLIVIPGSQQVYLHAMEEGLIQIFVRSGAHIAPPSGRYADQCHCFGITENERCLSTSGYMYPREAQGSGPEILYCNPAVAAASAVLGHLVEPFEMMRTVKRMPTGVTG